MDFSESVSESLLLQIMDLGDAGTGGEPAAPAPEPGPLDERLVVATDARSLAAEYFHYLALKVDGALPERRAGEGRVLLVTGPSRGSGKTVCSLNLALAFARSYPKGVLFLDADNRAGQAQDYLGYGDVPLPGLTDVLHMARRASSVLLHPRSCDLTFFPSGPYVENAFARTVERELPRLFDGLRRRYPLTVVDTPPAFPLHEAGLLSSFADGVVVVLGAGRDGAAQLNQTLDALKGANVVGLVLNNLPKNVEQQSRYGRYYGRYYGYGKSGRGREGRERA